MTLGGACATPQYEQCVRVGVNDGVVFPSALSSRLSANIALTFPNVAAFIHNSFAFGISRSVPIPLQYIIPLPY